MLPRMTTSSSKLRALCNLCFKADRLPSSRSGWSTRSLKVSSKQAVSSKILLWSILTPDRIKFCRFNLQVSSFSVPSPPTAGPPPTVEPPPTSRTLPESPSSGSSKTADRRPPSLCAPNVSLGLFLGGDAPEVKSNSCGRGLYYFQI